MKNKTAPQRRTAIANASTRHARVSPTKARLVIDQIRGLNVNQALAITENLRRKSNPIVRNVLKSAIANAVEKGENVNPDNLVVIEARVDKGRTLRRIRPRAMGRATQILKRSSHIWLSVG
jgi:large subunit ribosomal protein L22